MKKNKIVSITLSALLTALLMPGILFAAEAKRKAAGSESELPKYIALRKNSLEALKKAPTTGKDFIEMRETENLTTETFAALLEQNSKQYLPTLIARVTTVVNGQEVYHYFAMVDLLVYVFGRGMTKAGIANYSRFKIPGRFKGSIFIEDTNTFEDVFEPPMPPKQNVDPLNRAPIKGVIGLYAAYGAPDTVRGFALIGDDKILTEKNAPDNDYSVLGLLLRPIVQDILAWEKKPDEGKKRGAPEILYWIGDIFMQPFTTNLVEAFRFFKATKEAMTTLGVQQIGGFVGVDPGTDRMIFENLTVQDLEKRIKWVENQLRVGASLEPQIPEQPALIYTPPLPGARLWDKELKDLWAKLKKFLDKPAYKKELPQGQTWFEFLNETEYLTTLPALRQEGYTINPMFDEFLEAFLGEFNNLKYPVDRANLIAALDYILPFVFGTGKFNADQQKKLDEILDIIGRNKPTGKKILEIVSERAEAPKVPTRKGQVGTGVTVRQAPVK